MRHLIKSILDKFKPTSVNQSDYGEEIAAMHRRYTQRELEMKGQLQSLDDRMLKAENAEEYSILRTQIIDKFDDFEQVHFLELQKLCRRLS